MMKNFVVQKPDYNKKKLYSIVSKNIDTIISSLDLKNCTCNDFFDEFEVKGMVFIDGTEYEIFFYVVPHSYFLNVKYTSEAPEPVLKKIFESLKAQLENL